MGNSFYYQKEFGYIEKERLTNIKLSERIVFFSLLNNVGIKIQNVLE
jgi:hypothetical protein